MEYWLIDRVENVQLNLQRNRLIRDHELVCKENERLLKKLHSILSKSDKDQRKYSSIAMQLMPSLSASSPSLLSLMSPEGEETNLQQTNVTDNHEMRYSNRTKSPSRQVLQSSSERYKNVLLAEEEGVDEQNGLFLIKERHSNEQLDSNSIRTSLNTQRNLRSSRIIANHSEDRKRTPTGEHKWEQFDCQCCCCVYVCPIDHELTLDLTIRGKSAVNNSNRIASTVKRRNWNMKWNMILDHWRCWLLNRTSTLITIIKRSLNITRNTISKCRIVESQARN